MSEAPGCSNHSSAGRLKPKSLKLLSFNARGLTSNIVELDVCAKEYSLDIILVQESFLKPHMRKACKLRNYVQLRTDRLGTSGRDTLEFDVIAPLNPTHFPDKDGDRPDILDIALMKNVNLKLGCIDSLQRLSSDHRPVLMRLGPTSDDRPRDKKITTNWKKVSIALEEIDTPALNKIPNDIESTNDIDNAIGKSAITTGCPYGRNYPTHRAYWQVAKALKSDGYEPVPALKNPDTLAFEDREKLSVSPTALKTMLTHLPT
ncbi:hypothetical protein EVAR_96759_1 [Eumeta japonica]|uniref:RNA-directed DNA polymerase from mobile element jockey n=1 Tax=Eumeta variegata TaxID=151549 RepID=A0A4C1Y4C0_EUMVA|nr:hypothetical protein EVAR_96759_1 [Eumeta japonica]